MIDFLLGVPGKLKTISEYLTTNWTTGRAAKLDFITVAPAPASTALTNATWTDALATKLNGGASLKVPTNLASTSGTLTYGTYNLRQYGYVGQPGLPGFLTFYTTGTTLVDAVNVSGSGVLEFCSLSVTNAVNTGCQLKVTIDGTVVHDTSSNTGASNLSAVHVAAGAVHDNPTLDGFVFGCLSAVPFKTSLRVQYRVVTGGNPAVGLCKYYMT